MSTDTQIEANRANALLSTGPVSLEGKAVSRQNALKSGLSSRSLILPENEARLAESRKKSFADSFNLAKPDGFSEVLLAQIAAESVRIERCQQEERLIREHDSAEAGSLRDLEQRIAACELGKSIHDDPEVVGLQLETTYHGNQWLKGRWLILNKALELRGTWDAVEAALALDLAGTPALMRESMGLVGLEERKALASKQLERLDKVSLLRWEQDRKALDLAELGVSAELDKRLKTLRRYETASRRAFDKSLADLRRHLGEIKANVKEGNELDQASNPEREECETKPSGDRPRGTPAARSPGRVDSGSSSPAPMGFSSRPTVQPNREQRRKQAAATRSA